MIIARSDVSRCFGHNFKRSLVEGKVVKLIKIVFSGVNHIKFDKMPIESLFFEARLRIETLTHGDRLRSFVIVNN